MTTPPVSLNKSNKVVVACLDGQRLKGYVYNFSALKPLFRLFPEEHSPQQSGADIKFDAVKAVFFVKDFAGSGRPRSYDAKTLGHGRGLEVTFADGEKIIGATEGYNPQKLGFFMFPADPESNNQRIFVVNKNAQQVKLLPLS